MKKLVQIAAAAAALSALAGLQAALPAAGHIDFGKFTAAPGAEFVEVNVNSNLIAMVTGLAQSEPEVASVLRGLQSIRVNVLGVTKANRQEIQDRLDSVRSQLDQGGWDRVVSVMNGKEDVGVYLKTRGPEAVEGVVVTVFDGQRQAVFVNVVGDLRPEQLTLVGERFNIEPLKRLPGKPAQKQASAK